MTSCHNTKYNCIDFIIQINQYILQKKTKRFVQYMTKSQKVLTKCHENGGGGVNKNDFV